MSYVELSGIRLLQVGGCEGRSAQARCLGKSFEQFLLEVYRGGVKERKKIPLHELQDELVRWGWHV